MNLPLLSIAAIACLLCGLLTTAVAIPLTMSSKEDYLKQRSTIISEEVSRRVGGRMMLTRDEQVVNQYLMKEKRQEMDSSRFNRTGYLDAMSFYLSKDAIDKSPIFKLIKRMPKGGILHAHELAVGQGSWVVKNATYRPNVYMCADNGFIKLAFFSTPPGNKDCVWKTVESERKAFGDADAFDNMLIQNITLLGTDPLTSFKTTDDVWDRFNAYFTQVMDLLYYAPVMRDYFRQALQDIYQDNVQYIEMRCVLPMLFLQDKVPQKAEFAVKLYQEVAEEFVKDHPDFSGAKVISTSLRMLPVDNILSDVKEAIELRKKFPNFMLGYDLVGQEAPNYSLEHYLDALLYPSQQDPPVNLPYFFHAAETNWQGTAVDYNLVDALLLNTSRIGHGYGLIKHPLLAEMVKARDIAVEINPISNQVLGLVKDVRNHALIPLLADDFPVVISSDDPGAWSALPLSHDFYVAFMTMSGRDADLSLLKQLAYNSLRYSMMGDSEKMNAIQLWKTKWTDFITELAQAISMQNVVNQMDYTLG